MAKTHHNIFIGATDGLITAKSKAQITIGAGNRRTVALPGFSEGRVNRVYVRQATGTPVGFDVELLASKKPYAVGEVALAAPLAVLGATPAAFRAFPKLATVTAGSAHDFWESWGHPFINQDQVSHTANERFIYLTILPAAGGATAWEVVVITTSDASD